MSSAVWHPPAQGDVLIIAPITMETMSQAVPTTASTTYTTQPRSATGATMQRIIVS